MRLPFPSNSDGFGNLVGNGLREAWVPVEPEAEERGLEVVLAAHAERQPHRRHNPLPRLAVVLAGAVLLAALVLSPAGASVRDWVSDVFTETPPPAKNGLAGIPGGGRLLVQSGEGPWVVEPDGTRHRLGDYDEASWSPHGLYVAAANGHELSAVAPGGEVRWSLTAPGTVHDPRWSPSGFLVAYRAGAQLRVVAGDGSEERPLDDSVAPLAPSWSPSGSPELAYVDAHGALRVLDVGSGRSLARATALLGIRLLEWSGDELLEASRDRLRVRRVDPSQAGAGQAGPGHGGADRTGGAVALGRPRQLPVPAGEVVRDAALAPGGDRVAALLSGRAAGVRRSELVLFDLRRGGSLRPLTVPGRLTELAWSPDGRRLLVGWPRFDEWLFLAAGRAEGKAVTGIARAFAAGNRAAAFPRVAGWCCRGVPHDGG